MELLGCGIINTVKNVGKRITVQNKKVGEIFSLTKFLSMYATTDIHYTYVIDIVIMVSLFFEKSTKKLCLILSGR